MSALIEHLIIKELCLNPTYRQKALPYLKQDYFDAFEVKKILGIVSNYIAKYKNDVIDYDILLVELQNATDLKENDYKNAKSLIDQLKNNTQSVSTEWMIDQTENFCKKSAIANALFQSLEIFEKNKAKNIDGMGAIPDLLSEALKVSFDHSLGHDYFTDAELAFDSYTNFDGHHIPFNLHYFDLVTHGGIGKKTLNIVIAGTGGGKSLFMCHCAANYILNGYNVLYLTGEMAETEIRKRIDANILDLDINQIKFMSKNVYLDMFKRKMPQIIGKLKIKEFEEGGSTNAYHISAWIDEYKTKENFVPDIVIIDYLTLLGSSRVSLSQGMYLAGMSVSEEVRALSKRHNVAILTGAQFNREGNDVSDPSIKNTGQSMGIPFTADFMFALVNNSSLSKLNQQMVKQLKNRYGDVNYHSKFVIGLDKPKMRYYDVELTAQFEETKVESVDDGMAKLKKHIDSTTNMFE